MNLPNGYILQEGKYKLLYVVGQGGFGITYSGVWYTEVKGPLGAMKTEVPICVKEYFFKDYCFRDLETNEVKVHSETGKVIFEKFKEKQIKEAKILSDVTHPYIVNVLEVFEENNTAYIVMEYITGCSLKFMLERKGILPENKLLKYTRQIGEALQFVHSNNILHLDIKPSNILIDKNDNARLIDFGVSKRYDIESQETSTTMLTLSKGFASIEQYDNEGTQVFSPCPDIYSLGATMYNLLTNKIPTESILRATRPLIKPSGINPAISAKTEAVILKAMEIVPANRFQSAREMIDALDVPVEEPSERNMLREVSANSEDETMLLTGDDHTMLKTTLLNPEEGALKAKRNKRGSKKIVTGFLLSLSVICLLIVGFFVQQNHAQNGQAQVAGNEFDLTDDITGEDFPQPEMTSVADIRLPQDSIPQERKEEAPAVREAKPDPVVTAAAEDKKEAEENTETEDITLSDQPSVVEIETKYAALIASGRKKMNTFDFSGARNDFNEAKAVKMTEEVVRLLISCDTKEAEQQIQARMQLYEEKMTFGRFRIVRKKDTGKYGAINDKGEEKIPCKYIMVGNAEKGRAFEREDHLFDIYNEDGILLGEGLTYY